MIYELKNYSNTLKRALKEDILSSIPALDAKEKTRVFDVFCYYVPNKERAYVLNNIASCYGIEKNVSFLLEIGMELIFAAYYLRDDLLDEAPSILGQKITLSSAKTFELYADVLNEIGNIQIAKYCTKIGTNLNDFIFEGFLSLCCGQMRGLENSQATIEQYLDIAYYKNGAMMEKSFKMLLPLISTSDGELLVDFATSFGIASQIRNDVEDFLKKDDKTLFQDVKTRQTNFVLSVFKDRTGKDFYKEMRVSNDMKYIYSTLYEDIVFSIKFLYAFRNDMITSLNSLKNVQCKEILKDITNCVISFKEYD